MAIFYGVVWIGASLIVPKTYAPVLLRQRAKKLCRISGKVYRSYIDIDQGLITARETFKTGLSRPWLLLFREPIVMILSIYSAIIYGTLYMLFGSYPIVYQLFAVAYSISFDHKRYQKVTEDSGGFAPPEARLHGVIVGGCILPLGLFWFA
jgi:hypothetical protein